MLSLTQLQAVQLRAPSRQEWLQILRKLPADLRDFLRAAYIEGPKAILRGNFSKRQGTLLCMATMPILLGVLFVTVPGILFPSPGHKAYYHFAVSLGNELIALVPMFIGIVSTTVGLKLPVDG